MFQLRTLTLIVYDFFKFRVGSPDPEVFQIPELTLCNTAHTPHIPDMRAQQFRARMEIKDYTFGKDGFESPVYDLDINYDYNLRISRYTFATAGFPELVEYFGDTTLEMVSDFRSDVSYLVDLFQGNCSGTVEAYRSSTAPLYRQSCQ